MYLKAIEMQGFKSFANKINLDFHDGITAIVGPNGSGKSNIADAMRWVLGEQSAKTLRGSSMKDVIFAGSSERRAYSYAYVSIILDNRDRALKVDFDEVVVSRRVYRSGESEYLLNDSVCRLKDVQELFYDTGIGKEGYSIIGQGQIDRILSEKPEERRELFDEAAGIVKFKRNKAEAVKKLESEQQSLERVNDIINELEIRIPTLEKDCEKAKAFLKLRDNLRENEINFFKLSYKKLLEDKTDLEEKIKIAAADLHSCEGKLQSVKDEYSLNQDNISHIDNELSDLTVAANDKEIEKQQYEAQIDLLKEQINTLNEKNQDCIFRSEEQKASLDKKTEEKNTLNENQKELLVKKESLSGKVESLEKEFEDLKNAITDINQSNHEQANEIFKLSGSINSTQASLSKNKEQLDELYLEIASLNEKKETYALDLETSAEMMKENDKKLKEVSSKLVNFKEEISNTRKEIEVFKEDEKKLLGNQSKLIRESDSAKSKQNILQTMLENYEGYSAAIKKIMERKEENPDIIGVVADIINIDSKYELALEIALGSKIQNIIVKDDKTAKSLIEILKKNKYGRATFLPLNHIQFKDYGEKEALLKEKGVLGYAYNLVKVDASYSDLIKSLLGSIIVVDHIDNAILLSKKYKQSVRIVTLQGELFSIGGSITGGDYKKSYNLLGRKNEISSLNSLISELDLKLEGLNKEYKSLTDKINVKLSEIDEFERKNVIGQEELNELKINHKKLESMIDTTKRLLSEINLEIKTKESRLTDLKTEISENEKEIFDNTEYIEKLNKERADRQTVEDDMKKQNLCLAQSLETERINLATLNQELNFNQEALLRLEEEIGTVNSALNRLQEQAKGALVEVKKKTVEIESVREQIEQTKERHNFLLSEIEHKTKNKTEIMSKSKDLFKSLDDLNSEYQRLNDEQLRLFNISEKNESNLQQQLDYMWTEYELSISALEEYEFPLKADRVKLEHSIREMKKEIKEFGIVNVGSIDEHREVYQRLEFLTTQRSDIERSEAALLELIKELDIGMCEQFKERFKLIAEYFDKVFKKLFGGGTADLQMLDDKNILDTGIRIHVQPPGKKLQSMTVLSGGEKALTAIALLFAIQSLKPSPFCLLDEIEAALDDSNVDRFADYLMNLTDKTQFIIITHRKGTMTAADRLYGITMQEKGISSLVSVNLVEKELS